MTKEFPSAPLRASASCNVPSSNSSQTLQSRLGCGDCSSLRPLPPTRQIKSISGAAYLRLEGSDFPKVTSTSIQLLDQAGGPHLTTGLQLCWEKRCPQRLRVSFTKAALRGHVAAAAKMPPPGRFPSPGDQALHSPEAPSDPAEEARAPRGPGRTRGRQLPTNRYARLAAPSVNVTPQRGRSPAGPRVQVASFTGCLVCSPGNPRYRIVTSQLASTLSGRAREAAL
ncbi:uncharacterized protein [Kogia breviceps]|uniref:uncharacterized protein n=1 Tax=Kogia breviceps TaxID=27615 RepID=UPI0034D25F43